MKIEMEKNLNYHFNPVKKLFSLALFVFLISSLSYAIEIRGEVLNQEGEPVPEAVVLHRLSKKQTVTDKQGFFVLDIPPQEKVRLEVIHPDYLEQEIIIPEKDFSKKITVKLLPLIRQREEVVVTALRYPELATNIPAAGTVISKETMEEKMSPNITSSLQSLPGVNAIGSGGFSVVPSIRGLARRRVLIMVDNARITSDRRTGPNASFIDPLDIEKVEVLRSPSSVFYGSDAIGGVIHMFTRMPPLQESFQGTLNLKYGTVNKEKKAGLLLQGKKGHTGFFLSLRGTDAENYVSPLGKVPQSYFSSASLFGKLVHQSEKREVSLSFLGARGFNIGKPNRDSLTKPTWYPREQHNLLQFHWREKEVGKGVDIVLHVFLNPNFLETKKEKLTSYKEKESFSRVESLDFGFQLSGGKVFSPVLRVNAGIDLYGRFGVRTVNRNTYFTPEGGVEEVFEQFPFTGGRRSDWGVFISFDYSGVKSLDLVGGLRLDFLHMRALPGDSPPVQQSSHRAWTGFIGASLELFPGIISFVNLSKAYRAPSLSERFYSGITGRGFVIGKPDLLPETSFNLDVGLKFVEKRYFLGLYLFRYRIDDMIERYLVEEKTYTYGNIDAGLIQGIELEAEYYPVPGWKIFSNLYSFKGRSKVTETPLNDIPPFRALVGTRVWKGHFWAEVNAAFQLRKKDPGPAEIPIGGYEVVNIEAGYLVASSTRIYLSVLNLFNKTYRVRPDPDVMESPGRSFDFGLRFSF
ncbi:MAG: TonB-dependent receptor [Candidatus Aminicenantales bacterium]